MGKVRTCDESCHGAKRPECECWCGGLFHGKAGEASREAFVKTYGADPSDERQWSGRFRAAIKAAQEVRGG